jgi:peptide/nickel transport system substrate-binding protein
LLTPGVPPTYGYDDVGGTPGVSKVECPDAQTVKLDFNKIFVDWPDLFGGVDGFILQKSAFSSVPGFPDKPDLKGQMRDTIPFSGGPWQIGHWTGEYGALVRNPEYWGDQPPIDQMTFLRVSRSDPASALSSGAVRAIFVPRATQSFPAQVAGDGRFAEAAGASQFVDALWLNVASEPLRNPRIRQAIAQAFDRGAVSQGVPGLIEAGAPTNDCGPWVPGQGPWCPATGPFARYAFDADRAIAILKGAGFDCSAVADGGFCTKGGKPLTVTISTVIGDVQQGTAASLLETSALNAGINVQVKTYPATQLFSDVLPTGHFQIGLYGVSTIDSKSRPTPVSPADPSVSALFTCNQIPTRANGYSGGNWVRWCSRSAHELMRRSDVELDQANRADEIQAIGRQLAMGLPILPLFSSPNAAAWRTDQIAGVDPKDVSSPYGFYFGASAWTLQS